MKPWLKTSIYIVIGLIIALALAAAFYFFKNYQSSLTKLKNLTSNNSQVSKEETAKIISDLSQIYVLPESEEPTIATVVDVEKVADQPFFAHAKNGDKIVIYSQSLKAILYRPETHKIIDVTTITPPTASGSATPNPTPNKLSPSPKP